MSQIFDRRWILDTNALSYIAGLDREAVKERGLIANDHLFCEWPRITNPSQDEAALILQRLIIDRKVGVRIDGDEDWRFFQFALPEPNGGAFNLKLLRRIEGFEVNSDELLAALPAEPAPTQEAPAALPHAEAEMPEAPPKRHAGGAPAKYDWNLAEQRVEEECRKLNGVPGPDHPDPEWRRQSHIYPIIREVFDDEPSDSALKRIAPSMLNRIAAKMDQN